MPRQARKKSESGIYHVMLRGINQQQIFEDKEDYDMKRKEILTSLLFNTLKILGAGWLGALCWVILSNVVKAFIRGGLRTEYILLSFVSTAFAAIALIVMSYGEWYKERTAPSTGMLLFCSVVPALLHMLLCLITYGNTLIFMFPKYFATVLANMDVNAVKMSHIFLTTLIFNPIYAISLFVGGLIGRKKRLEDRKELCEKTKEQLPKT